MSRIDAQPAKPSILIVDDTPENIDILKEVLDGDYTIRAALNGEIALKIANGDPPPDLILLDIMMPNMDGYEVVRKLNENPGTRSIPVIFITALADIDSEVRGLRAGAADYITKPFNSVLVRARVATHLALGQARRQLERQNEELTRERMLVEDIIIRMRGSKRFDDRYLCYLLEPVDRTNGDILLATFAPDGRQWVLVGDLTGHGLSAAVAAPLVAHVFYGNAAAGVGVEETVLAINEVLYEQLPTEIFMAGAVVEVSADRSHLGIWNGGMPEALLVDSCRSVKKAISTTGIPPFGIRPTFDVAAGQVELHVAQGDRLYLFSDGVTEVMGEDGDEFGITGVERFLAQSGTEAPLAGLLEALIAFHGSDNLHDDVTAVELRISLGEEES